MRFGSVCSGIEAASVAWHPLGWRAAWLAEIEPFPSAVLAHHYPEVPNHGDMTRLPVRILTGEVEAPDIFCGGTPCQAFSVAGLRQSLDDARGNLSLTFCEIADAIDHVRGLRGQPPAIIFWENVPGVLSTADNAFGCFLAGLAGEDEPLVPAGEKWTNSGCVYGPQRAVAWRTLDAQYFGVAQRRRRVFVVASARDGFDPAAVLFEFDGLRRDTAPRREAGKVAPTIPSRSTAGGGLGTDFDCDGGVVQVCPTLRAGGNRTGGDRPPGTDVDTADSLQVVHAPDVARCIATREGSSQDWESTTMVAHSLRGEGFDASEDGTGRGTPLVPVAQPYTLAIRGRGDTHNLEYRQDGTANALLTPNGGRGGIGVGAVAVRDTSPTITSNYGKQVDSSDTGLGPNVVFPAMQVRRLTPVECERLQGFPDNYTAIPWRKKPASECPDGPRYKALGNSWAVPVVRWIGQRISNAVR